ncbi:MAG: GDSL-type esterase/lipase family protein, partial [Bryobacterales bacterium]|nr:GDSL-type esterase/lipase family protein [Bryobacterales bacterium]
IRLRAANWEMVTPALGMKGDGKYGLGGVSFVGRKGAYSEVTLDDPNQTHLRVYFEAQPGGGDFEVAADGNSLAQTRTDSPASQSAVESYALPPGTRQVSIQVRSGEVRVFGMEFSRARPGIVYSSLGLNGANTTILSRSMDARHWAEQLREADPRLVVINYGTNESVYSSFVTQQLETELRRVIQRIREAEPDCAILVMSPMDRGVRGESGEIVTPETIPEVVRIQERVAADLKVAFFNTYEAMGGAGTMAKWYRKEPRLVGGDYIHPMPAGAKLVGDLLFEGLNEQYQRYKLMEMQKALTASVGKPATEPRRRKPA